MWHGIELEELSKPWLFVEPRRSLYLFQVRSWRLGQVTIHVPQLDALREQPAIEMWIDRLDRAELNVRRIVHGVQPVSILEPLLADPSTAGAPISMHLRGQRRTAHYTIGHYPIA